MTLRTTTVEELRPVLDILTGLPRHTPFSETERVAERLGWVLRNGRNGRTNLPVDQPVCAFGELTSPDGDPELGSVYIQVSDTARDESKKTRDTAVHSVFPSMVAVVTECLGFAPTRPRPWGLPGSTWDLPQGGQVNLTRGASVVLEIWYQRMSDAERDQVRRGEPITWDD